MASNDDRRDNAKANPPGDVHAAETVMRTQESDIQALIEAARRGDARPKSMPPAEELARKRMESIPTPALPFAVPFEAMRSAPSVPALDPPSSKRPEVPIMTAPVAPVIARTPGPAAPPVPHPPPPPGAPPPAAPAVAPPAPSSDHDVAARSPTAGPVMAETPPPPVAQELPGVVASAPPRLASPPLLEAEDAPASTTNAALERSRPTLPPRPPAERPQAQMLGTILLVVVAVAVTIAIVVTMSSTHAP